MKAVSTHSIEHIRVHLPCEAIRTRLLASIRSLSKKVGRSAEKVVAVSAIILVASLFVTVFMKLGECSRITTNYCDICDLITKMIFIP